MKIYVLIFLAVLIFCVRPGSSGYSSSGKYSSHYSHSDNNINGVWKSKTQWKFQWVKEWHVKKVFIPVWKKVWTPVEIKEWIPIPNTPHR